MKIFTSEFEDRLVSFIGTAVVVSIALLFFGIAGGIELGLIFGSAKNSMETAPNNEVM